MGKTFAVIGDPIDHSLSPNIHSAAFRELNLDCSYIAYRIPKDELGEGIEGLKNLVLNEPINFDVIKDEQAVDLLKGILEKDQNKRLFSQIRIIPN